MMTERELLIENLILDALNAVGSLGLPQSTLFEQIRIARRDVTLAEFDDRIREMEGRRSIVVIRPTRGASNLLVITDVGRAERAGA